MFNFLKAKGPKWNKAFSKKSKNLDWNFSENPRMTQNQYKQSQKNESVDMERILNIFDRIFTRYDKDE